MNTEYVIAFIIVVLIIIITVAIIIFFRSRPDNKMKNTEPINTSNTAINNDTSNTPITIIDTSNTPITIIDTSNTNTPIPITNPIINTTPTNDPTAAVLVVNNVPIPLPGVNPTPVAINHVFRLLMGQNSVVDPNNMAENDERINDEDNNKTENPDFTNHKSLPATMTDLKIIPRDSGILNKDFSDCYFITAENRALNISEDNIETTVDPYCRYSYVAKTSKLTVYNLRTMQTRTIQDNIIFRTNGKMYWIVNGKNEVLKHSDHQQFTFNKLNNHVSLEFQIMKMV